MMTGWQECRARFPWPLRRPATKPLVHGWHTEELQWAKLLPLIPEDGIVLEIGAWTGKTSLHIVSTCSRKRLVAVDIWTESAPALGNFWPQWRADGMMNAADTPKSLFLANLWDHQDRVVPIQADSVAGMLAVLACGVAPDLVYVDADHGENAVYRDVTTAIEAFPDALICGHDFTNNDGSEGPVSRAVRHCAAERNLRVDHIEKVWWYER